MITSHLDYITKSFKKSTNPEQIIPQVDGLKIKHELGRTRQYEHGYELECGGFLLLSESEKQGAMIELSGLPLLDLRDRGIDSDMLLKMLATYSDRGLRTTRIDYCWNVPDIEATVLSTYEEWKNDRVKTRQTIEPEIRGRLSKEGIKGEGATLYFGSEKSDNRVTVYDKAYQMKLLGQALTRVELRIRNDYAQDLVTDMMNSDARTAAQSKLKKTLDFPALDWWQKMYDGKMIELTPRENKAANGTKYLINTVAPLVKKHIHDTRFRETLAGLMIEWIEEMEKYV